MRTRSGASGRHQVALAHDVVEGAGPQARRQRGPVAEAVRGGLGEEVGAARAGAGAAVGLGTATGPSRARRRRGRLSRPRGRPRRPELAQRRRGERLGGTGHGVGARLGLREGDHLAEVLLPRQQRAQPVDADGEAAVGRRAVAEGAEQEPEAGLGLLGGDAEGVEHARAGCPRGGYGSTPTRAPSR